MKKRFINNRHLKASALLYALFIVMLMTMVVFFFLTAVGLHNRQIAKLEARVNLYNQCQSAIEYLLANNFQTIHQDSYQQILHLKGVGFKYELTNLGQYKKVILYGANSLDTLRFDFLVGSDIPADRRYGLQLKDYNKPLNLAGNTHITGQCLYPKRGIEKIYFDNVGFSGHYSESFQDTLLGSDLEHFFGYSKQSAIDMLNLESTFHSFMFPSLVYLSDELIELESISLSGNIVIKSERAIIVNSDVELNQITLDAPKIVFKESGIYNAHLYSSDSLLLHSGVELSYPSSVVLKAKQNSSYMEFSENTRVSGVVKYLGRNSTNNQANVLLKSGSLIQGELLVKNGLISNSAKIIGSAILDELILETHGAIYQSAIKDAYIDPLGLPEEFLFTFPHKQSNLKILEWLN